MPHQDIATLHAARCWQHARAAVDPSDKAAWIDLVVGWTKLALDPKLSSTEAERKALVLIRTERDKLK